MKLTKFDNGRFEYREKLIANHAKKAGLRGKINAKCIECIYCPFSEGTWRKQVQDCNSTACPLWDVRPTMYDTEVKHDSY